jgi:hypothetical protein
MVISCGGCFVLSRTVMAGNLWPPFILTNKKKLDSKKLKSQ